MCRQDRKIKTAVAALALALALVAGTGLSALSAPGDGTDEGSSEPTVTTSQPVDSEESSTRPASSDEPDSSSSSGERESSSSQEDRSSRASSAEEEDSSSQRTTTTSEEERESSREEETVTSRRTTTSRSGGGTLTPDEDYEDPEFEDISWGAQYVEETSMPETVSTAGPTSKDIADYYAIAMRWIWLPILLICVSLFGLIAVNYRAHKQKKVAMQKAAGRGRTTEIPMTSGRRPAAPAEDDDDVFIASDSHMRPPSQRTGTGRRPSASHAKKRVRRPRD